MAPLDPTTQLAIAELVIYIIIVPIILYILLRHGPPGYPGWGFLIVFCGLRVASDGFQISDHQKAAEGKPVSSAGAIINSIGISGLVYSLSGIIHECYHRIPNHNRKLSLQTQLVLHILITSGIALSAIGASNLSKPESATNNHSTDETLRRIGSLMIFLTTMLLVVYALYTYRSLKSLSSSRLNRNAIRLLYSTMLTLPFTCVRAIYGLVYTFDSSPSVNPITGVFVIKLLLIFLVQLLAALSLIVGGVMTRNIRVEDGNILGDREYLGATSSESRRGGPGEQHTLREYGVVQQQEAKNLASQNRGAR